MNKKTYVVISAIYLKLQMQKASILEQILEDDPKPTGGELNSLIIDRECVSAKMEVLEELEELLKIKTEDYVKNN